MPASFIGLGGNGTRSTVAEVAGPPNAFGCLCAYDVCGTVGWEHVPGHVIWLFLERLFLWSILHIGLGQGTRGLRPGRFESALVLIKFNKHHH